MKKNFAFCLVFILIAACSKEFSEINTNPNAPVSVQPELLLRQVIYDVGDEMAYEGFVAGNLLGQYFTAIDFNLFDRHSLTEPQFGGNPWPTLYRNLRDNEIMLKAARSNTAASVYVGPGLILKAYLSSMLTDIYGDVPYSDALQGPSGEVTPTYDSQEAIYLMSDGILHNLEAGISAINNYQGSLSLRGDIIYQGDLSKWRRFAQSLQIKYLMRISDKIDVGNDLQTIYSAGDYIDENNMNAVFPFSEGQPNNFRMANLRAGDFNLFIMSETVEDILVRFHDPRIEKYFRPYANASSGSEYRGLLNGPDASQTSISVADYSLTGRIFREEPGSLNANFMTAWETMLLLAEAAEKGLIGADPKQLYEQGVKLAFDYWQTTMPEDYLTNGAASYRSASDKTELIITQKWLANILNGYEGWIEFRRTGYPKLKRISASLNNDLIPVRMPYPADEEALNNENFKKAIVIHQNSVNAPVWWDVN